MSSVGSQSVQEKRGSPRARGYPRKHQKRHRDHGRIRAVGRPCRSSSCLLPRGTDALGTAPLDVHRWRQRQGRRQPTSEEKSRIRRRKAQAWKEASFRCDRNIECGRGSCWRPEEGEQRRRAERTQKHFEDFVQFTMKQESPEGVGPAEGRSMTGDF